MKTTDFIRSEVAGGAVLLVAVIIALIWANAPFGESYTSFWHTELTIGVGEFSITEDLQHWVNDGLMAIFFFVVGLEIKRELTVGELNSRKKASLPIIAALGGVILPALVFISLNAGGAGADGWAIPMATDIAFAVAVLALIGSRIPAGVRLLLLSIAIVDDVIAIAVIAIFYSGGIDLVWLAVGVLGLGAITGMERIGIHRVLPFILVGVLVWVGFYSSGVHATIAGVALGLLTPAQPVKGRMVLEDLEHKLHPYTSLLIIPIFALANAGIVLSAGVFEAAVANAVFWGVVLGLVLGKTFGIGLATLAAQKLNLAETPDGVKPIHVWGIAALGGIGFTVSIFIAQLAFLDPDLVETAKVGIFTGSVIAAIVGSIILIRSPVPDGVPTVADRADERR
ncbi:MAG: Na+/H+ antiporter NhaA [Acidobacteriota bacterium]